MEYRDYLEQAKKYLASSDGLSSFREYYDKAKSSLQSKYDASKSSINDEYESDVGRAVTQSRMNAKNIDQYMTSRGLARSGEAETERINENLSLNSSLNELAKNKNKALADAGIRHGDALLELEKELADKEYDESKRLDTLADGIASKQLGIDEDVKDGYREHVRRYCDIYRPQFLSFGHYQFNVGGDTGNYLLNLGIIRQNASAQGVPFFNGVQACTWTPGELASPKAPRIPGPDELRYLVHTTAAYGAHGIYYLVYSFPKHGGSIANMDGTPGPNYEPLKRMNRDFVALARELKPYRFVGAYLQGLHAPGTTPWCEQAVLEIAPKTPTAELQPNQELVDTTLITRFDDAKGPARFMVVNLDYRKDRKIAVRGPAALERFDPVTGTVYPNRAALKFMGKWSNRWLPSGSR